MSQATFHPTPAMQRLADALLEGRWERSVQATCKAARIKATTYRTLLRDERFLEWLNERARAHVNSQLWRVRLEHLRLAMAGNLQAVKLMYDRYDAEWRGATSSTGSSDARGGQGLTFADIARLAAEAESTFNPERTPRPVLVPEAPGRRELGPKADRMEAADGSPRGLTTSG